MLSIVFLVTICLAWVTTCRAEEVESRQETRVDSRLSRGMGELSQDSFSLDTGLKKGLCPWLSHWMGGLSGGCIDFGLYDNFMFAKADDTQALNSQAVILQVETLHHPSSQKTGSYVYEKGPIDTFLTSYHIQATNKMITNKLSSASWESCASSLVSPNEPVGPSHVPASVLRKTIKGILKAPSNLTNTLSSPC